MQLLAWTGFGFFCLASLVVGIRLLQLWWKTRELPELLGGASLLLMGPFGFVPAMLSSHIGASAGGLGNLLWACAFASLNLGCVAIFVFTVRVFHPRSRALSWMVAAIAALLTACWFLEFHARGFAAGAPSGPPVRVSDWLRTAGLLWAAFESLRYFGKMRRRIALGLGDPVVAMRFLLWGTGIGAAGCSSLIDATTKLLVINAFQLDWLNLCISLSGSVAALALWMAFLPPRRLASSWGRSVADATEPNTGQGA